MSQHSDTALPHTAEPEGAALKALEVIWVTKTYPVAAERPFGKPGSIKAVDKVSFSIAPGETLGLVGESGCGKTTVARAIMGLIRVEEGSIFIGGKRLTRSTRADRRLIRSRMQMVFQDPYASLNPLMTVDRIIREPMMNMRVPKAEQERRLASLIERVGLRPEQLSRTANSFSGGQRQRIGIARALAMKPELLICDEPVSALDVSVQAEVLNLFKDLQRDLGLAMLFVTHDMAVVEYVARRVAVMYAGTIVEIGPAAELIHNPRHPYTQALISAIPRDHPDRPRPQIALPDSSLRNTGTGCPFAARCHSVTETCRTTPPPQRKFGASGEHLVVCHLA